MDYAAMALRHLVIGLALGLALANLTQWVSG